MHPVLLEDIAGDTCMVSSCGRCVLVLFQPLLRTAAWHTLALLAGGWALATERHTRTTSLWLTGAPTLNHFSRFSVFLGGPLSTARWPLWAHLRRHGARRGDPHAPSGRAIDDFPQKNAGRHSAGREH
jgi:hypothetical protein